MSKKLKQISIEVAVILMAGLPLLVAAQITSPEAAPITSIEGIVNVLNFILSIVYTVFFVIAAIFIIIAGFTYLTAGGEDEKIKKAKQQLIYAIVAIAIGLLSVGVSSIVKSVLSGRTTP